MLPTENDRTAQFGDVSSFTSPKHEDKENNITTTMLHNPYLILAFFIVRNAPIYKCSAKVRTFFALTKC
jgi:hypothetical protein